MMEHQYHDEKPPFRSYAHPGSYTGYLLAILIGLVGIGNMWIGHSKGVYYQSALTRATQKPPRSQISSPLDRTLDMDSIYAKRMASRISYYQVVFQGGAFFVVLSLAVAWWHHGKTRSSRSSLVKDRD
jgi:hypothetical protein